MKFLSIAFFVILIIGCQNPTGVVTDLPTESNCVDNTLAFYPQQWYNTGINTFTYYENSTVQKQGYNQIRIKPGNKTVFKFYYRSDDRPYIFDDEYGENFWFEVDSGLNQFSINTFEIDLHKAYFDQFIPFTGGLYDITRGCINGTKISSDTWHIEINIEVPSTYPFNRNISEEFHLDQ